MYPFPRGERSFKVETRLPEPSPRCNEEVEGRRREGRQTHLDSAAAVRLPGEVACKRRLTVRSRVHTRCGWNKKDKKKIQIYFKKNKIKNNQATPRHCDMRTYALLCSGTHRSLRRWMEVGGASEADRSPATNQKTSRTPASSRRGDGLLVIDGGVSMTCSAAGVERHRARHRVRPGTDHACPSKLINCHNFPTRSYQLTVVFPSKVN